MTKNWDIKVMVVDDKSLIRNLIKNSIKWDEIGMEIIEEASDGEEALEKVEIFKPDLIIMDINIPFIDGLKLSQIIHQCHPRIKIIILTGYQQFEYVRAAIKIDVLGYIVKPINAKELRQVRIEAKQQIYKDRDQKKYVEDLERQVKDGYNILKEKFLNTLIQKPISNQSDDNIQRLAEKMRCFNLKISPDHIAVMVTVIA